MGMETPWPLRFLLEVRARDPVLFWFGAACLLAAFAFALLVQLSAVRVNNVNAWIKPFKFAVSIGVYAWTMAWYLHYLPRTDHRLFAWLVVVLFGLEIVYIAWRAAHGERSHYNTSTPLNGLLYGLMGLFAAVITAYTGWYAWLFFTDAVALLPVHYLWAIRAGLVLFVVFGFEGFVMGSRMAHTVGAPDGTPGIQLLHWSVTHGDLRVAHFVGMHALQVLPLLAHTVLRTERSVALVSGLYAVLALGVLVLALNGRPVLHGRAEQPVHTNGHR